MLLALLGFQVAFGIVVAVVMLVGGDKSPAPSPIVLGLGNVLCFGIVLLWGCKKANQPLRTTCSLAPFSAVVLLPIAFGAVGLSVLLSEFDNLVRHVVPAPESIMELMRGLSQKGIWSIVLLAVVAPITEEPLFRGLILGGFLRRYSVKKAVLVSAALFSLLHVNPYQLASGFVLGIALAWVLLKTRSLWPCMILHAFYNSLGFIVGSMGVDILGYTERLPSGKPCLQPLWFDIMGVVLLGIGIVAFMRTKASPPFGQDRRLTQEEP